MDLVFTIDMLVSMREVLDVLIRNNYSFHGIYYDVIPRVNSGAYSGDLTIISSIFIPDFLSYYIEAKS